VQTILYVGWSHDRTTLMAIEGHSLEYNGIDELLSTDEFKLRVYCQNIVNNLNDGHQLYLGKMIMEKERGIPSSWPGLGLHL